MEKTEMNECTSEAKSDLRNLSNQVDATVSRMRKLRNDFVDLHGKVLKEEWKSTRPEESKSESPPVNRIVELSVALNNCEYAEEDLRRVLNDFTNLLS